MYILSEKIKTSDDKFLVSIYCFINAFFIFDYLLIIESRCVNWLDSTGTYRDTNRRCAFTLTLSRLREVHQNARISQLATLMIDDLIATRDSIVRSRYA